MTNEPLGIWKELCETDPKYTKEFKRSGGFSGTAQNPTYAIRKMTELFGSCGKGWGTGKPEFTVYDAGVSGVLVYCTLSLWYIDDGEKREVYGVGGDTVCQDTKYGLKADDEAFKKANTDALTNAMKMIGMAADLHLGMYDDSKYVNYVKEKIAKKEAPKLTKEQQELKDKADNINKQLQGCQDLVVLDYVWAGFKEQLDEIKKASPDKAYPALEKKYRLMKDKLPQPQMEAAE